MQASTSADLATLVAETDNDKSTTRSMTTGKIVDEQTPLLGGSSSSSSRSSISSSIGSDDDDHTKKTKKKRQASEWFVIAPLFFISFCVAAIFPPQLQLYTEIFCHRYYEAAQPDGQDLLDQGDIPLQDCTIPEIQESVASATAVIQFLNYGTTLFTVSYYGHLSDSKSRKLVMWLTTLGMWFLMASNVITAFAYESIGISLIFVGPFLRGALGGDSGFMAAVQAYISDCTDATRRTVAFGHMLAAMLCGVMLGANVSSILIKQTGDLMSSFYLSLGVLTLVLIYLAFIPESEHDTAQKHKEKTFLEQINVYKSIKQLVSIPTTHGSRYALPLIALAQFMLAVIALPPVLLYTMLEFGWTAYEGGYLISLMSFLRMIQMMVVFPLLVKLFMRPGDAAQWKFNIWIVRIGCAFTMSEMFAMGLATDAKQFVGALIIGSFSILSQPAIRSLLTTSVAPENVGQVLSAMAVLDALGWVIAQFGLNAIYSATVMYMPSMTFHVCGIVGFISFVAACFAYYQQTDSNDQTEEETEQVVVDTQ